jgi:preprotein translocase subunit YajC
VSYSFFQPATAPGRDAPSTTPAQPAPTPAAPAGDASPGGIFGGANILLFLLPLLLIFMMTRNQNKKQKQLEASLKVGDRVVTQAGLIGRLVEIGERTSKLEIAPGVNVQVLKSSIQGLDPTEAAAKAAAAAAEAKAADAKTDAKAKEPVPVKDKPQEKKA